MNNDSQEDQSRMDGFYQLKIRQILSFALHQKGAFWAVLVYMIFEYLRPQQMYPVIDVIPWGVTILGVGFLLMILEGRLLSTKNQANLFLNIFFVIILISSFVALSPSTSFENLKAIIALLIGYYLLTSVVDTEERLFTLICFYLLINLKLSQFVFRGWIGRGFEYDGYSAVAGFAWLRNPGELAVQMCIAFSIGLYFAFSVRNKPHWLKRCFIWFLPLAAAGSVLACGSRGGFLAFGVVLFLLWWESKRKIIPSRPMMPIF